MTPTAALTFDDGPWPGGTDQILELLREDGVLATFFVWGEQAAAHPELVQAALEAGHQVQPHCWSHATSHHRLSLAQIRADIEQVLALLGELGVPAPHLWRPPYGEWQPGVTDNVARECGMKLTGWTIDTLDWTGRSASVMYENVMSGLSATGNGVTPVILLHDGRLERNQSRRRRNVDQTIELVRRLLAEDRWSFGPQVHAVLNGLSPAMT